MQNFVPHINIFTFTRLTKDSAYLYWQLYTQTEILYIIEDNVGLRCISSISS